MLQTYVMPLADFVQASPTFDPTHLRSVRLVFDRLVAGTVVVDDIGISATAGPFVSTGSRNDTRRSESGLELGVGS